MAVAKTKDNEMKTAAQEMNDRKTGETCFLTIKQRQKNAVPPKTGRPVLTRHSRNQKEKRERG